MCIANTDLNIQHYTCNIQHTITHIPILVLNWNNASDTLACLTSLQQLVGPSFQVWVLDNGSDADDLSQLKSAFPDDNRFTLLTHPTNLGFTQGVNYLLETLVLPQDYKYVALLNNDTEVEPQWLEALLAEAETTSAGMVASKMINFFDRDHLDNVGHFILNTGEILPLGHDEPSSTYTQPMTNMGACAGAALYRVDMLRDIGIFDTFFNTGYEDAELGLRATLTGYHCRFAPKAIVYHKISRSINKIRDYKYTLKIQIDVFYTAMKCWPRPNLIINMPFFAAKIVLISIMNLIFGRWKFMLVLIHALKNVLFIQNRLIRTQRQHFQSIRKNKLPWWQFQHKLTFFLTFDMQRFYKYIWKREKMVFEKY